MSSVVNDRVSDEEPEVRELPRQFYFVQTHPDSNHKIDKIDLIMLILSWVVSAWSVLAERLIDQSNEYVSARSKFWIGVTIPVCTSAIALIETIQVGMEYHDKNQHANGIHELREGGVDIHVASDAKDEEIEVAKTLLDSMASKNKTSIVRTAPSKLAHSSTATATNDNDFLFNGKVDDSATETDTEETDTEETDKEDLELFLNKQNLNK